MVPIHTYTLCMAVEIEENRLSARTWR